ncbi:MAG TPA: glycosyltransferase [Bacteroidota bacterium]|nr:glycosyltransferase [Bacteroidota bacterium]
MNVEFCFTLLLGLLFLSYCTLNSFIIFGLKKLLRLQQNTSAEKPNISVIVAARNEEANIGRCLQSLVRQNYPPHLFEIIVADDRSTDGTAAIVKNYQRRYPNITLVTIGEIASGLPPKKNALNEAIKKSRFDILAFTDADCAPPDIWLTSIAREFLPDVGAVAGYCPLEQQFPETLFGRWFNLFLRYLEIKKTAGAAAGVGLGHAYLASGGNFAYRKAVFHEVNGFEKIKHSVSGDDDLFLQVVQRDTRWKIRYMTSRECGVETVPPRSLGHFIKQKRRHISAARHYTLRMKIEFGLIHSFNALAVLSLVFFPWIGLISLAAKFIIDTLVFHRATSLFGDAGLRRSVVPLEIASVIYNSLIGPLGLVGTVNWKGGKT